MTDSHGNYKCKTSGTGNTWNLVMNRKCRFHGSNNTITSRGCKNVKFSGFRNALEFANDINLKFQGDKNSVKLRSNEKLKFIGNCNKGELKSNANSKICGDHNFLNLSSNKDTKIFGNNNFVKMTSNTNATIQGDRNTVNASKNENLTVEGNYNKITSLVDTISHHLKIAEAKCTKNRIEAEKWSGWAKDGLSYSSYSYSYSETVTKYGENGEPKKVEYQTQYKNPLSLYIDYVYECSITREKYRMGIFDFNMKRTDNGAAVEATFDHAKYDNGMLNAVVDSRTQVTLAATKDGKKETLEMVGPAVSLKQTNGITKVKISE